MRYVVKKVEQTVAGDRIAPMGGHYECVVAAQQLNHGRPDGDYLWGRLDEATKASVMALEPDDAQWVVVDTKGEGPTQTIARVASPDDSEVVRP